MQVANLNQLVQNALQELDYLSKDFVCSGLWCPTTASAYKRFLIDENVDPHFAGVQPVEAAHLPKTLFDYIFDAAESVIEQVEDVSELIVDLIDPQAPAVIVSVGAANFTPDAKSLEVQTEASKNDTEGEQRQEDNEASGQEKQDAPE